MKPLVDYILEATTSLKTATYEFKLKHSGGTGKIQIDSRKPEVIISQILGSETIEYHIPTGDFLQVLQAYANKTKTNTSIQQDDCGIYYNPLSHTLSVHDDKSSKFTFEFSAYELDAIVKDNKSIL